MLLRIFFKKDFHFTWNIYEQCIYLKEYNVK
jgi:hypothetical protein